MAIIDDCRARMGGGIPPVGAEPAAEPAAQGTY